MRRFIAQLTFFWLAMTALALPSVQADVSTREANVSVGDGQRISLREGEITILTIRGWEISRQVPGLTLLMKAPIDRRTRYQRTIQIAGFNGARYMDEITAKEFEGLIVRKLPATSASIQKYRMRNSTNVELADGRPALLFYSEFTANDVNLMQAHLLVSTERRHFLITYTDVASHFEGSEQGPFFEEAWASIRSVQLRGEVPKRFHVTLAMLYIVGGLIVLVGVVAIIRINYSGQSLKKDVLLAFDEKTAFLAQDAEASAWTLPESQSLKKKGSSSDIDDDLLVEDEVS